MDENLLKDLETIQRALKERNRILSEKQSNYEQYIDKNDGQKEIPIPSYNGPKCPTKPKAPIDPHSYDRELKKDIPLKTYDKDCKYQTRIRWAPKPAIWVVSIILVVLGGNLALLALSNMQVLFFLILGLIGVIMVPIGVVLFLTSMGKTKKESAKENEEFNKKEEKRIDRENMMIKRKNLEIKQYNEPIYEKIRAAEEEMKFYEEQMIEYQKALDEYNKAHKEYEKSITEPKRINQEIEESRIRKAKEKLDSHNRGIDIRANEVIPAALKRISTYYPEKYIYVVDDMIGYIKDARADTLKEAINLYESEKMERSKIYEMNATDTYEVEYWTTEIFTDRPERRTRRVEAKSAADACAQVEGAISARKL